MANCSITRPQETCNTQRCRRAWQPLRGVHAKTRGTGAAWKRKHSQCHPCLSVTAEVTCWSKLLLLFTTKKKKKRPLGIKSDCSRLNDKHILSKAEIMASVTPWPGFRGMSSRHSDFVFPARKILYRCSMLVSASVLFSKRTRTGKFVSKRPRVLTRA